MPNKFEDRPDGGPVWQDREAGPVWDRQQNAQVFEARATTLTFGSTKKALFFLGEE